MFAGNRKRLTVCCQQAAQLNKDCLALKPSTEEAEKLKSEIRRIVHEATVLPGERPRTASRDFFDIEAEISDAWTEGSGNLPGQKADSGRSS